MTYDDDHALLEAWGVRVLAGDVALDGVELDAFRAGHAAALLGLDDLTRSRVIAMLRTPRERVAYVIGYGRGRAAYDDEEEDAGPVGRARRESGPGYRAD